VQIALPREQRRITTELDADEVAAESPYGLQRSESRPGGVSTPQVVPRGTLPQAAMPPVLPNSTAAIVSLVFGILAWTILPLLGAIVAIVAGHIGRREIRNSDGQLAGSGMATGGLILGYAQLALAIVACVVFVLIVTIAGFSLNGLVQGS
jgi:hypothetical protein